MKLCIKIGLISPTNVKFGLNSCMQDKNTLAYLAKMKMYRKSTPSNVKFGLNSCIPETKTLTYYPAMKM